MDTVSIIVEFQVIVFKRKVYFCVQKAVPVFTNRDTLDAKCIRQVVFFIALVNFWYFRLLPTVFVNVVIASLHAAYFSSSGRILSGLSQT